MILMPVIAIMSENNIRRELGLDLLKSLLRLKSGEMEGALPERSSYPPSWLRQGSHDFDHFLVG